MLLRKDIYPDEYMDSWENFNGTVLPPKKAFYSSLNLEDISMRIIYIHKKYGMCLK